jgi:hypothetical protein
MVQDGQDHTQLLSRSQYHWLCTDEGFHGSNPPSCSLCSRMIDRGSPLDFFGGCQVIIRKAWSWSVAGMYLESVSHPCTINTSSVYFGKKSKRIVADTKYKVFRPYPTLHTYSVVVEYRCPIPSLIFFVPTQFFILIQWSWSSNIVTPSLLSSFSSLPNSPYLFSCRRISLLHPFPHFLLV